MSKNTGRKTLGEIAWDEYVISVGGYSYDDKPLPGWYDLGIRQREGWCHAADAAVQEHRERTAQRALETFE